MPFPAFLSAPELDDPTWLQQLIETGAVTEILSGSSGEAQHVNSLSDKLMILSVVCKCFHLYVVGIQVLYMLLNCVCHFAYKLLVLYTVMAVVSMNLCRLHL